MFHCSRFFEAHATLVELCLRSKSIGEVLALWLLYAPISIVKVFLRQSISQAPSIIFPFPCLPWIMCPSKARISYALFILLLPKRVEVFIDTFVLSLIVFDER